MRRGRRSHRGAVRLAESARTVLPVRQPRIRGLSARDPVGEFPGVAADQPAGRERAVQSPPRTWFNQRLTLGLDITGEDNLELARVPNQAARQFLSSPTDLGGGKSVFRNDFNTATIDYGANAKANISSTIKSTSSVGVQYFRRRRYLLAAAGAGFPAAVSKTSTRPRRASSRAKT